MQLTFKDLNIGDEFDFISPNAMLNSFFRRCRKVSARKYRDDSRQLHTIGSISAKVYHVERAAGLSKEDIEARRADIPTPR